MGNDRPLMAIYGSIADSLQDIGYMMTQHGTSRAALEALDAELQKAVERFKERVK